MYPGNPNCDGNHCSSEQGQVRVLPYSGDGNLILCQACYHYEMAWRKDRNKELASWAAFKLPAWSNLKIYDHGNEHYDTERTQTVGSAATC